MIAIDCLRLIATFGENRKRSRRSFVRALTSVRSVARASERDADGVVRGGGTELEDAREARMRTTGTRDETAAARGGAEIER